LADVFISYSRLDQERVKLIADRLTSLGYSVWRDRPLRTGQAFVDEIERELDSARAVLTVWSHNARNSTWVFAESSRALDAGKLLQLRLDRAQPPLPFDALECADMSADRAEWGQLEDALSRMVRGSGASDAKESVTGVGPLATPAAAGAPKLLSIATGAALVAYAGAVSAAYAGVMAPEQLQLALFGVLAVAGVSALVSAQRLAAIARAED
jgi:hypothetical protein